MNAGSKCTHPNLKQIGKDKERNSASRYALHVALQTMKDRCQKLQNRLSCLEEENLQLRIEKHRLSSATKVDGSTSISVLEKKVTELSRQKSQLSHHILMVATENKELWQRLSKLTEENESLGNHLITISDTLSRHPSKTLKPDTSINFVENCNKVQDGREESLEEISLRVLNSLMKGKTMLENQCEEMMELQNGTVSIEQCGFTLDGKDQEEGADESLMAEMKDILEKMKNEKTVLKQQQEGLKKALEAFRKVATDGVPCRRCILRATSKEEVQENDNETREIEDVPENVDENGGDAREPAAPHDLAYRDDGFEDRVCPLCGKFFPKSVKFNDFNTHVLSHFVEEENQEDSISDNFEVIT